MPHLRPLLALLAFAPLGLTGCHRTSPETFLPGSAHPAYTITDLGEGTPTAINKHGQVAGRFKAGRRPETGFLGFLDNDPVSHGFLWSSGKRTEMPTLGGWNSSATALDDAGHVLGNADISKNERFGYGSGHPCFWDGHALTDLSSDPRFSGKQLHLTPAGAVYVLVPNQAPDGSQHLWFYPQGAAVGPGIDRGRIGDGSLYILAISDAGTVTGLVNTNNRPFIWHIGDKQRTILGTRRGPKFAPTFAPYFAQEMTNRAGQIIGTVDYPNSGSHAALWDRGQVHDLGTLAGGKSSSAKAINASGQIVGNADVSTGKNNYSHPVLWEKGKIKDLSQLIPSGTHWSRLESGADLNDQGQIVGEGYFAGNPHVHGFLLTPIAPAAR